MNLSFSDWASTLENITKIGAFLGFAWLVVVSAAKWIFRPIKDFFHKVFTEDRKKLDFIVAELKPNGGGSIKDQINLIKDSVMRTEVWQKTRLSHENLPYFDTDQAGRITWINKSFMRLFNASESDIIGYGIRNFIDPKDKHKFVEDWNSAIQNAIDLKSNFRIRDSAGHLKCMEFNALAVRGGHTNQVIGYTGVLIEKEIQDCET